MNPFDGRYESIARGNTFLNISRDLTAGFIVAMIAIPLAMGFAIASGLRPEQGIVGGAVAGLVGALVGGSKYQVYGPTAAFIPIIAAIVAKYDVSFLILVSLLSGATLCVMGLAHLGRFAQKVPHSIVVGFTIGIAAVIAGSQLGEVFGIRAELGYSFIDKFTGTIAHAAQINPYAILLAAITFFASKILIRVSVYFPAPLIGIGISTILALTVFQDKGLVLIKDKFGSIPTDLWLITLPSLPEFKPEVLFDLSYFVLAVVFVAAVESLLCSRMADRLANNQGLPFNPNKELWGQGLVNIIVPLLNGFPHTGALARTATNIRLGANSPLAGIAKAIFKLGMAVYLAQYLELIPMAAIGGILFYVASGMLKLSEIKGVWKEGKLEKLLLLYTAIAVILTDFLTGVLSAILIYSASQLIVQRFSLRAQRSQL